MTVKVSKDACIGCGACQAIVPNVFDLNDEGFAYVLEDAKIKENEEDVRDAAEGCPTSAISIDEIDSNIEE